MSEQVPSGLLALWKSGRLAQAVDLCDALKNLEALTIDGRRVALKWSPGSRNAVLDFAAATATGDPDADEIPSQTGNAGRYLQTNGDVMSWAAALSCYTEISLASAQSLANNTTVPIAFDTTVVNANGVWASGNASRFTVPAGKGGVWLFTGWIIYAANGTGVRQCNLRKNGSTTFARVTLPPITAASEITVPANAFLQRLVAGDYVELTAFQTSGGALNASQARLAAYRLGD